MTYWPQEKLRSDQRNKIVNIIIKIKIVLKRKFTISPIYTFLKVKDNNPNNPSYSMIIILVNLNVKQNN